MISLRIPMKLGNDQVEISLKVSDADARKIVDAPRKTVRTLDAGLFQVVRDGLRSFFEAEERDVQR